MDKQFVIDLLQKEETEIIAQKSEVRPFDNENKNFLCYDFTIRTMEVNISVKSDRIKK